MFYFKRNVGSTQRIVRVLAGAMMLAGGVIAFNGQPAGYAMAAMGVMGLGTGLMGYCPACAMIHGNSSR